MAHFNNIIYRQAKLRESSSLLLSLSEDHAYTDFLLFTINLNEKNFSGIGPSSVLQVVRIFFCCLRYYPTVALFKNPVHFCLGPSIRIGKVLIGDDQKMLYTRLMTDIARRRVLLLYPLLITGDTVVKAIQILLENGVREERIFLLSVFSTPNSLKFIRSRFKRIVIVTSEICTDPPAFFTTKYFGTD